MLPPDPTQNQDNYTYQHCHTDTGNRWCYIVMAVELSIGIIHYIINS